MAHINVSIPSQGTSERKVVRLDDFSGGVSFCDFSAELFASQSPYMKNLMYSRNLLRTRFGQAQVGEAAIGGELHSKCETLFFGYYVFHIGTSLCSFDGTAVNVISETMPDCDSFIFEMNSQLYIFCREGYIFILDKQMKLVEYDMPSMTVMTGARYDLSTYTEEELPDGLLFGSITVGYMSYPTGFYEFKLPVQCDTSHPVKILDTETGTVLSAEKYTVSADTIKTNNKLYSSYRVTYTPVKGSKYRRFDKIMGCTTTVCYGGKQSGGTRVFFSGNKDYPGYYFYSELLSPLTIYELSYDIIGNGSENINRFAKQKGDLIALCDRSVYRISYSFDINDGADFSVSEISTAVGCDMPGSVQLIDNRIVFANSRGGVYIIVASDYTDELSIRSISANINGAESQGGLLSLDTELLKNSISVDYGRKYYLFAGKHGYVWDYGISAYTAGVDPISAERRLSWYYLDELYENSLFYIGELFGTYADGEFVKFARLSEKESTDFGKPIVCEYRSRDFDVSCGEAKKVLNEVYLNVLSCTGAELSVTAFGDGKAVRCESFVLGEDPGDGYDMLTRVFMKVPGYEAYRFSFSVQSTAGLLGIYDLAARFRTEKILYR